MTVDPLLPVWAVSGLAVLLAAFIAWRGYGARTARARLGWALRLAAVLLLAVAALRPVIPAPPAEQPKASGGLEVYIVADTTSSMAAEDWAEGEPRLNGVKADVRAMAEQLRGASFSLVTFDAAVVQRVPMTSDATALASASDVLAQEITAYSRGSSIDEPLARLTDLLADAEEASPDQRRVLFYLGDGEQTAEREPESFAPLAPYLDGGAVLGYGSAQGARMLSYSGFVDPNLPEEYILDYTGGSAEAPEAISRIDEARLSAIAAGLGVPYVHRTAENPIDAVLAGFDVGEVAVSDVARGTATEFYWLAAVGLGVIALVELLALSGALAELRAAARGPRERGTA
jgi:Ca-activated chloride channel family protein